MEPNVTQSTDWYKLWAWAEMNRRQITMGAAAVIAVGLIAWYFIWQKEAREISASEALSVVAVSQMTGNGDRNDAAEPYLKVAAEHPKSSAGIRAALLAAGNLYTAGKYDQARTEFEKFIREHGDSPMVGQAHMGVAASLDSQGKTAEAITAYKKLTEGHSTDPAAPQAHFSLARLYEAQNNPDQARAELQEIVKDPYNAFAQEAGMRLEELNQKFPRAVAAPPMTLKQSPAPGSNSVPITLEKK